MAASSSDGRSGLRLRGHGGGGWICAITTASPDSPRKGSLPLKISNKTTANE
jgi:hypothetical protein